MSPGLRRLAIVSVPTLATAFLSAGILLWYLERRAADEGRNLNQTAWEHSYVERGLPVPASGPREGYWGARLGAKVHDPILGWHEPERSLPGLLDIDGDGFQHYPPTVPARFRVVIFGGSVAFGSYASSIATTYFHVLGAELERLGEPTELVVVAGGAWKAMQEVSALLTHGERLRPDLVVLLDGLNDLTNGATSHTLFGQQVPTADGSPWTAEYHAHDYTQRVSDYLTLVDRASRQVRALGCDLLVVLQPSLAERARSTRVEDRLLEASLGPHASAAALTESYAAIRRGLAERAARGQLYFLDASRLFDGESATTFTDLWHFSDAGHALLGTAMARDVAPILARRAARQAAPG